jgi:DNA-directed RNA polymerase subunit E'/Rpb7
MNELVENLSKKYGLPVEEVKDVVSQTVEYLEKDLPLSVAEHLQSELEGKIEDPMLQQSGWAHIP